MHLTSVAKWSVVPTSFKSRSVCTTGKRKQDSVNPVTVIIADMTKICCVVFFLLYLQHVDRSVSPVLGVQFSRASCLPQRNQWRAAVICFLQVFGALVTLNRKRDCETSGLREETAAASSSASEWLSSGFVSAAALQSSHSLWVWNYTDNFGRQTGFLRGFLM